MNTLLTINHLNKSFKNKGKIHHAVKDISLCIDAGECLGLVGESGCGKSTVANVIAGFMKPDSGEILFDGKPIAFRGRPAQLDRKDIRMIFQNPRSSLNPRMSVTKNLEEAVIYYEQNKKGRLAEQIRDSLVKMGLPEHYIDKYPDELSGGECQRVMIAKSLMRKPKLLICDEITSALDVSMQAEILRYLIALKEAEHIAFLFITHDLAVASQICDTVAVMKNGQIIETGSFKKIMKSPDSEYTRSLINAACCFATLQCPTDPEAFGRYPDRRDKCR